MARTIGDLIRLWRHQRGLSQLELGAQAQVSTRHVSRVETGLAEPSREMVLRLGRVLGIPRREQNAWLQAAGFASAYRETPLEAPEMAEVRQSLHLMLDGLEPLPAAVVDRRYDVRCINTAWARMGQALGGGPVEPFTWLPPGCGNVVLAMFDPAGMRPQLANWEIAAAAMLDRLLRERTRDPSLQPLLDQLMAFPGVPELRSTLDRQAAASLLVPLVLELGDVRVSLVSTITTLGTPQDLTLAELHIEALHPTSAADRERLLHLG